MSCPGISVGEGGDTIELCLAAFGGACTPVVRSAVPIGGCFSAGTRRVVEHARGLEWVLCLELLGGLVTMFSSDVTAVAHLVALVSGYVALAASVVAMLAVPVAPLEVFIAGIPAPITLLGQPVACNGCIVPVATSRVAIVAGIIA